MLYVIIGTDKEDSLELRMAARPAHIERLETLKQQGRLRMAGPFPAIDNPDPGPSGFTGSLIVAEFDTLQDAKDWANSDPYVSAGVYADVSIKPFKYVLP
jgi:hypothetical protein